MGQNNTHKNSKKNQKQNPNINQQNISNNLKIDQQKVNKSIENNSNINQLEINNPYVKYLNSIKEHKDWIESVKIFPSGKIISTSNDCSIKIYDGLNYNIIQNIENAHKRSIMNI